jgi:hypothetical protein
MEYRKIFLFFVFVVSIVACKEKKKSLSGDEQVIISDFVSSFAKVKLPYQVSDTTLNGKEADSSKISYKIFTQFVPDSVLTKFVGKGKPALYPLASVKDGKKETYLFAKALLASKKTVLMIVLDKEDNFVAAMPFLEVDKSASTKQVSTFDNKFTINKSVSRKNVDNTIDEGKDVYVFNTDARNFTLIMTDPLDENLAELINPIDTFPRKNKYSADYVKDKKNIVSIRDANKAGNFIFFIHMEKDKGECNGELKGYADFTSANTAVYRQGGDPCSMEFKFTSSSVTLKEIDGCGNRRDLRCTFNAKYLRKKEPKTTIKKKTTSKK